MSPGIYVSHTDYSEYYPKKDFIVIRKPHLHGSIWSRVLIIDNNVNDWILKQDESQWHRIFPINKIKTEFDVSNELLVIMKLKWQV